MRTTADKHKCQYFNQCFEKLFWYNVLTIKEDKNIQIPCILKYTTVSRSVKDQLKEPQRGKTQKTATWKRHSVPGKDST